jgi:hypothetical protein
VKPNTVELNVNLGDKEFDLLEILAIAAKPSLDLERAGYMLSIGRLQACEFARAYESNDIPYIAITEKGRKFIQKEVSNGNPN